MKDYKRQMIAGGRLATLAQRFFSDRRGVAAMEFALIAPILIMLYLGSIEVTSGFDVNKKLGRATNMIADLVTQQQTITTDQIRDIMNISAAVLLPYRRDVPQITVTAINIPASGSPTVAWSRRLVNNAFTTPFTAGTPVTINANMIIPNTSVIRVETQMAYVPFMPFNFKDAVSTTAGAAAVGLPMSTMSFGRVRQGTGAVACSNC